MGRTILCNECRSTFDEDILKIRNSENECPVCGASLLSDKNPVHKETLNMEEEQEDWITWYYYCFKDEKGRKKDSYLLRDKPIDLDEFGDIYFLIKEFKAPPRDSSGSSEEAKKVLRTYIPDAFVYPEEKETKILCPHCFSSQYQLVPRKFSLLTGFATNKVDRICLKCNKRF